MISASLRCVSLVALIAVMLAVTRADAVEVDRLADLGWVWPATPVEVTRPFIAPAHTYGPGHRGVDLRANAVRSPADGRVAFVGMVAGRSIVTIDHGGGLVTTLEPVSTYLAAGDPVARGAPVGTVSDEGHTRPGTVHFGVRLRGEYVNPLRLLGGVPRAVLLPCC
ncbi:murein hydrolase activator EnvC family protein [Microbacterium testaceum]|uniref:murein hydrolase activator EnvC family protein n=1 Tax=Microbacterium testaceum TaxID=2033 RepID=UPI002AC3FE1F|nr:M23 family metallopeptidase [Microbacterium testaceum]MDZ5145326.1 M23 family metallopeptidase [Microbacterium testaceum]